MNILFFSVGVIDSNNKSFYYSFSISIEDYTAFPLFFKGLISTVDRSAVKSNIFSGLLFLRRPRRANRSLIDTARTAVSYIFYSIFIVFRTATLSIIYSGKKL